MHGTGSELVCWTDAEHLALTRGVLDRLGSAVVPLAVGSPDGVTDPLAQELDAAPTRDLRATLVDHPARFVLNLTHRPLNPAETALATEHGTTVLNLEPHRDDPRDWKPPADPAAAPRTLGGFLASPGFYAAAEPFDVAGRPVQAWISSRGQPHHGSLFARCLDACFTLLHFADLPETIWASQIQLRDPKAPVRPRPDVPDDHPRALRGRLGAMARCPDGSTLGLDLADDAPATQRRLHVLGPDGDLTVTDAGYRLTLPDGGGTDSEDPTPGRAPAAAVRFVDLLVGDIQRLIDRPHPTEPANPERIRQALACVHAVVLSTRTRQPESPRRLLEIVS